MAARKRSITILDESQIWRLMQACSRRGQAGRRNRAMLATAFGAGLRFGELVSLREGDIDWDRRLLRIRVAKGDQERTVGAPAEVLAELRAWLGHRKAWRPKRDWPVFCTDTGKPVAKSYFHLALQRLKAKAGLGEEVRLHAHGLRHAAAVRWANAGIPLHQLRRQLGHKHLSSTQVYVDHLVPEDLALAVGKLPSFVPEASR